jgi:hypothetical protein
LAARLANGGLFTYQNLFELARLEMIEGPIPKPGDSAARKNLWRAMSALLGESEPEVLPQIARAGFEQECEAFAATLPEAGAARAKMVRFLQRRARDLEARGAHLWRTRDGLDRAEAPARAPQVPLGRVGRLRQRVLRKDGHQAVWQQVALCGPFARRRRRPWDAH